MEIEIKVREQLQGFIRCSECPNSDHEVNIQLCGYCSPGMDYSEELSKLKKKLLSMAICPACAIRKHIKKGHEVIDFFPVLSSIQATRHIRKFEPQRSDLLKKETELKTSIDDLINLTVAYEKEIDRMMGMLKLAKTTSIQREMVHRVDKYMNKNACYIVEIRNHTMKINEEMNKALESLKDSIKQQEETDFLTEEPKEEIFSTKKLFFLKTLTISVSVFLLMWKVYKFF